MLINKCCQSLGLFLLLFTVQVCHYQKTYAEDSISTNQKQIEVREFSPNLQQGWLKQGISYGPFRKGQSPGDILPSRNQIVEDLVLISQHWNLIRLYGSREVAEEVLDIIREKQLPIRVMLGAWITTETESATLAARGAEAAKRSNQQQVQEAIRLANNFQDEVIAISVGNETQVYWTAHKTRPDVLLKYIRQVREATQVPVTTADDFNFWNKPESKAIAREVDFIVTHIHAMWAGLEISDAMPWTKKIYAEICSHHPDKQVVIGEAGWATTVHNLGEQARLIKGRAGEEEQKIYYSQFTTWARENDLYSFFFEAFDEPWKGGPHPNEVEKHWGVYKVDRKPKAAMANRNVTPK